MQIDSLLKSIGMQLGGGNRHKNKKMRMAKMMNTIIN